MGYIGHIGKAYVKRRQDKPLKPLSKIVKGGCKNLSLVSVFGIHPLLMLRLPVSEAKFLRGEEIPPEAHPATFPVSFDTSETRTPRPMRSQTIHPRFPSTKTNIHHKNAISSLDKVEEHVEVLVGHLIRQTPKTRQIGAKVFLAVYLGKLRIPAQKTLTEKQAKTTIYSHTPKTTLHLPSPERALRRNAIADAGFQPAATNAGKSPRAVEATAMNESNLPLEQRGLLTRRNLLLKAGATAAAAVITDLLTSGDAEAAQNAPKLILGAGSLRYECIHDWLVPPATHKWGDTQGVAQDEKGNIYISHTVGGDSKSNDAIYVFSKGGKFLRSFGAQFKGGGHGLDIRNEGGKEYLYHCDTAHKNVVKTTLDGTVLWTKGLNDLIADTGRVYKSNSNFTPTNVALAPNGDFYITDGYGSDYITQYNIKGEFIRVFGGKGKEPGKVLQAHGIWVDTRGKEPQVVVADRANSRMQYFTMDGKHIKFDTDGMRQPCHFHVQGDLLLVPDLRSIVTVLDKNNKVAAALGDGTTVTNLPGRGRPRSEFVVGKFVHPHSAKFLHNGDILVVEWLPIGRVTLLKKLS